MSIHHSQTRKAERLGFTLTQDGERVVAYWSKRNQRLAGVSAADAISQMEAIIAIFDLMPDIKLVSKAEDTRWVKAYNENNQIAMPDWATPSQVLQHLKEGAEPVFQDIEYEEAIVDGDLSAPEAEDKIERSENGVALDGAIAYSEGTPAADNPYTTETEDEDEYKLAVDWDEAWDAAADEAEENKEPTGSVVNNKYRAKYAEAGHPTHCGDWLADLLNNLCIVKDGTDLSRFEAICEANGVDLSKYNRTTAGWQGRLRMTGRNLLSKQVYLAGGVIQTPVEGAEPTYVAPAEWMSAQRFKMPKAEQAKPIPTATE